jgi:hypothetical protein
MLLWQISVQDLNRCQDYILDRQVMFILNALEMIIDSNQIGVRVLKQSGYRSSDILDTLPAISLN